MLKSSCGVLLSVPLNNKVSYVLLISLFACLPQGPYATRTQVRSKGMVEVLQFKATVWPKVVSESTYEAQKFKKFLGEHPPDPRLQ